ncbi:S1 family serine peptidase [Kitasatospora purpeofusca]|uniref:S1 family serine peptidase n=1 Tax=Kitasatospora purpeofusca TaxID=67352 RepID=UPI0036821EBF
MERGRRGPRQALAGLLGAVLAAAGLIGGTAGTADAVVGGTAAPAGAYPYQVSVQAQDADAWQPVCGGSIIDQRWVLTAAHCLGGTAGNRLRIAVGSNTLAPGGTLYPVQEAIGHEDHNGNAAGIPNDIGLLKLGTPITYPPLAQPIALPDASSAYPTGTATLTGKGRTSGSGQGPNTLQQATVTLLTVADCQARWIGQNINANHLCTYDKGSGISTCKGDSGGPLTQNGRLIGIISWGVTTCSGTYPSVYTNVSTYRAWITTKAGL